MNISEISENMSEQYIRIGTRSWDGNEEKSKDALDLVPVVVAQVDNDEANVSFLSVDTWTINGLNIGHLDYGKEVNIDDPKTKFKPDPPFEHCASSKMFYRVLLDLTDRTLAGLNGQPFEPPKKKAKKIVALKEENIIPLALPTAPSCAYGGAPPPLIKSASTEIVVAVVFFKNETGLEVSLNLAQNLQVDLKFDASYDTFTKWLCEVSPHGNFIGLRDALDSTIEIPWDLEIWVMPQIEGSSTMKSWTRFDNQTASDWLNATHSGKFGRYLYIEVHVIENKGVTGTLEKKAKKVAKKSC